MLSLSRMLSSQHLRLAGAGGLCLSLALNAGLAAWLLRPPSSTRQAVVAFQSTRAGAPPASPARSPGPAASAEEPALSGDTPGAVPFRWSEVESDDYRRYIAQLRAIGCPEPVIRDLIAADLNQVYAARAKALWDRPTFEYWQKWENRPPAPDQFAALSALNREQGAVYQDLLGVPWSRQSQLDLAFLQVHGPESELLFLPEARREAALERLRASGQEDREADGMAARAWGHSGDDEAKVFAAKLTMLAEVLSPEELEEFRLRHAPEARMLRAELRYFELTPEEFGRLLAVRGQADGGVATGDLVNRRPATAQARELFGEERAKDFEKFTDLYYIGTRLALEEDGLPVTAADEAWQIACDFRRDLERVAGDASLSKADRLSRLRELQAQANLRLNTALGERYARPARSNLAVEFQVAFMNLKP